MRVANAPSATAIRLRWTRTQRRPARRSNVTVTTGLAGLIVPVSRRGRRRRGRAEPSAIRRLGTTLTATALDSIRPRVASPGKTARTLTLYGSDTLVTQLPSGFATAPVYRVHAEPPAWTSTSMPRPAGDEPSEKRSSPPTVDGLTPRTVAEVYIV